MGSGPAKRAKKNDSASEQSQTEIRRQISSGGVSKSEGVDEETLDAIMAAKFEKDAEIELLRRTLEEVRSLLLCNLDNCTGSLINLTQKQDNRRMRELERLVQLAQQLGYDLPHIIEST